MQPHAGQIKTGVATARAGHAEGDHPACNGAQRKEGRGYGMPGSSQTLAVAGGGAPVPIKRLPRKRNSVAVYWDNYTVSGFTT